MTKNCVKVVTSINYPLINSRNWRKAQLEHKCIMLQALKRKNTGNRRQIDALKSRNFVHTPTFHSTLKVV